MKILFLLTQDLESPSGLGRFWPMARALADRGHELRIAALHPNWEEISERNFIRDGVSVEYVAAMHVMKKGSQKRYYNPFKLIAVAIRATRALYKAALSGDVDIIHICKPHPMNSVAGLLAARSKRSILCLDCDDYEAGSNRFQNRWQRAVVAYIETRLPRKVRLVTTNTLFMKSKLLSWGCPAEKILYLSNGIDRQRIKQLNLDEVNQLRTSLHLEGKSVVLYLGSLSLTSHPVDLLLNAIKSLAISHPDVALLIVGGGEDFQLLNKQVEVLNISHMTHFTGHVDPNEVFKYYALADVSVDPVYDDDAARGRSPLKLFESWACAVPFVTSDVGDRGYLLGHPLAGILVRPAGDPDALADGIKQVIDSPDLAQKLRSRGLEQVSNYTWDQLAARLEQEYLKLL